MFLYTAPTCFGPSGPSSGSTHQNLAKVTVSLKYQLKHFVKIVVVEWKWKFQFVVCALGAVWRHTHKFVTNLEQMLQCTDTDLSTKPTTTQQKINSAFKNARFVPDGCCCLSLAGNYVLCRINWMSKSILSCNPTGRSPMVWSPVNWEAKQQARLV
jgi:hypothetical protein